MTTDDVVRALILNIVGCLLLLVACLVVESADWKGRDDRTFWKENVGMLRASVLVVAVGVALSAIVGVVLTR